MKKIMPFSPPYFFYAVWVNLRDVIGRRNFTLKALQSLGSEMKNKIINEILFCLREVVVPKDEVGAKIYRERHLRAFSRIQLRNSSRVNPSGMATNGPSSAFSILRWSKVTSS
ncbi:hypothetical protein [Pseudomonas mosselii]|uniref:hypothetical protein n=1 Tax=Pseudomonas mosselii TaxID=78327 RepID=UPI0027DD3C18|nr:hypothetical protein [Pseudomonas mosselii]